MTIATVLLGSFLLYSTSKYFPQNFQKIKLLATKSTRMTKVLGCFFLFVSALLFIWENGLATGLIMFAITLFLALSSLVIALSVHRNFIYVFIAIAVSDMLTLIPF